MAGCSKCGKHSLFKTEPGWLCPDCKMGLSSPVPSTKSDNSANPSNSDKSRYPHLENYLVLMETVAGILAIVVAAPGIVLAIASAKNDVATILSIIMGAAAIAFGLFTYVATMAGVEFIRVVIDIESSSRQTATILQKKLSAS